MADTEADPLANDPTDSEAEIISFPSHKPQDKPKVSPVKVRDAIGDVLRTERSNQNRTLADVADDAAVSLQYLSEIERGHKEVSSDLLESISIALEIEVADVLERAAEYLRVEGSVVNHIGARPSRGQTFMLAA